MEERIKDLVIDLKIVESCNSYDELVDKNSDNFYINILIDVFNGTHLKFEDARKYITNKIEKEIIELLKEAI